MPQPRVALFTGNYIHVRDGVSLTLNRVVSYLVEQGVEMKVFGPTIENPPLEPAGDFYPVPSFPMPGRPEYQIAHKFPEEARKELEAFKPDLIHIATPDYLGLRALLWARRHKVPVVSTYHTHFVSYANYYKLNLVMELVWEYLKWFYGHCRHLYVPTQSMAEVLAHRGIEKGIKIWARGVETDLFNPNKRDMKWRREIGFDDDEIVVTFVSRLVWEKELETFADAVNMVKRSNRRVRAMVVGDGPAREGLEEMLPEAHFTGFLSGEQLARAYASSDVFFFPSHTETFGNVTLEAMSSGLPCLVADATGSRSLVEHEVNGCLGKIQDSNDFARKLAMITSDDEIRLKMGEVSREKAMSYRWDVINQQMLDYYHETLLEEEKLKEDY
jgi:glycosyltransferase involved in cell wall biosynthesis